MARKKKKGSPVALQKLGSREFSEEKLSEIDLIARSTKAVRSAGSSFRYSTRSTHCSMRWNLTASKTSHFVAQHTGSSEWYPRLCEESNVRNTRERVSSTL